MVLLLLLFVCIFSLFQELLGKAGIHLHSFVTESTAKPMVQKDLVRRADRESEFRFKFKLRHSFSRAGTPSHGIRQRACRRAPVRALCSPLPSPSATSSRLLSPASWP